MLFIVHHHANFGFFAIFTALASSIFPVITAFFNICEGSVLSSMTFFRYHQGKGTLSIIEHLVIFIARPIHFLGTNVHNFTIFFPATREILDHVRKLVRYSVPHIMIHP